ncbi:hypothetical protein BASA81_002703 [Batrachochytrium salamandrivorans]|nr:hypothetical protein BASA81_002703 [Batrachochytrium salamandrivorans]
MLPAMLPSRKRSLTLKQFTPARTDSIEIENVVVADFPPTKRMHSDDDDEDKGERATAAAAKKRLLALPPVDSKRLRTQDDVSEYSAINKLLGDLYVERVSRRERRV